MHRPTPPPAPCAGRGDTRDGLALRDAVNDRLNRLSVPGMAEAQARFSPSFNAETRASGTGCRCARRHRPPGLVRHEEAVPLRYSNH
jgi:hypothetical protein